jgi:hypothetical protein
LRLRGNALPAAGTFPDIRVVGIGTGTKVPVLLLGWCRCWGCLLSIPLLNVCARRCHCWSRIGVIRSGVGFGVRIIRVGVIARPKERNTDSNANAYAAAVTVTMTVAAAAVTITTAMTRATAVTTAAVAAASGHNRPARQRPEHEQG